MEDELVLPITTVEAIYMEDGITKLSDEMKDVLKYEEFDNESVATEIPSVKEEINGIKKDISEINSSLDNKMVKIQNELRILSNNQIPNEYLEQQIDSYIGINNSNLPSKTSISKDISIIDSELFIGTQYSFINSSQNDFTNTISGDWRLTEDGCESSVGYNLYKIHVPQDTIVKVIGADMYQIQTESYVPSKDSENLTLLEKGSCLPISYHIVKANHWLIVSGQDCKVYEIYYSNNLLNTKIDIINKFNNNEDYEVNNFLKMGLKDEDGTRYRRVDDGIRYASEYLPLDIPYTIQNNTSSSIIIYEYDKNGLYIGYQRVQPEQVFSSIEKEHNNIIRILIMGDKDGSVLLKSNFENIENIENYETNGYLRLALYNSLKNSENKDILANNLKIHNDKAYDLKVMCINTQKWGSSYTIYKNILKNHNCDIIGVQEHDSAFSDKSNVVQYLNDLDNRYNSELLPNDRFPVGKLISTKCDLQGCSHTEFNTQLGEIRGYQKGYIKVNGKKICVINAHLATSSAESAKIAQSMELLNVCKKEEYFILIADFNFVTTESQNEYELIAKPFIEQGYNLANWKDKNYIMTWSGSADRSGEWHPTDNIITSSNIDIISSFVDETKLNDDIIEPIDHLPFISYLKVN
jgi:endonuclease/exonuclease/phosphatase family metal-dependent hydrolase